MLFAVMMVVLGGVVGGAPMSADIPIDTGFDLPGHDGSVHPREYSPTQIYYPYEKREEAILASPDWRHYHVKRDTNGPNINSGPNIDNGPNIGNGPNIPGNGVDPNAPGNASDNGPPGVGGRKRTPFHAVLAVKRDEPQNAGQTSGSDGNIHQPGPSHPLVPREPSEHRTGYPDYNLPGPSYPADHGNPGPHPHGLSRRDEGSKPHPPPGMQFHHYGEVVEGGDRGWIPQDKKFDKPLPRKDAELEKEAKPVEESKLQLPPPTPKNSAGGGEGKPAADFRFFLAAQF
ncbi:hypothetical protein NDA16_004945 [Ustilago loliicola]|nr:hypothetical protein NDA16_004945 [Ustilago loliicola]